MLTCVNLHANEAWQYGSEQLKMFIYEWSRTKNIRGARLIKIHE